MRFSEMRERYDKYGAFSNYFTAENAKVLEIIPKDYWAVFPDKCDCGSDYIVTTSLTSMQCCDPRCSIKQSYALHELFSRFSSDGVGVAICDRAYRLIANMDRAKKELGEEGLLKTNSYIEILTLDRDVYPYDFKTSAAGENFLMAVGNIKRRVLTFSEMISKLGLPEMGTSSLKMFDGINSFDELCAAIKAAGNVQLFCLGRGFNDPMKMFWLSTSLEDIYVASIAFNRSIRVRGMVKQKICITGRLQRDGKGISKEAFINLCNYKSFSGKNSRLLREVLEEIGGSVTKDSLNEALTFGDLHDAFLGECAVQFLEMETVPVEFACKWLDAYYDEDSAFQLLEISRTEGADTNPYVIADARTGNRKYLVGERRGVERNSDGTERKVLVTSTEYLGIIEEMVKQWNTEMKEQFRVLLVPVVEQLGSMQIF